MATFVTISQGDASNRSTAQTWQYVNTTLDDEARLLAEVFLPIIAFNDDLVKLDYALKSATDNAIERFFEEGKFLTLKNYQNLNKALVILGFPSVDLPDDGMYWQPVLAPMKSPSSASWKENGKSRTRELGVMSVKLSNGKISLPLRIPPVMPLGTAEKLLRK